MARRVSAFLAMSLIVAACAGTGATSAPAPSGRSAAATPPASEPAPTSPSAGPASPAPASPEVTLRFVAIGDSIPFGRFDCGGCRSFPELFGDWIEEETGAAVEVQNLSQHDGLTAARLAVELPESDKLKTALADADVITVTIGHNDTPWNALDDACDGSNGVADGNAKASWEALVGDCLETEVERYRGNLDSILGQVMELRAGKPTAFRFTTQYADIPGDVCCPPEATVVSKTVKDAFNEAACEVAEAHGFLCIDVYHGFNGPDGTEDPGQLLADDHTHPSVNGHALIAELLAGAGLAPLDVDP